MTVRNIKKNLAGAEDLLQGIGLESQVRGGAVYDMHKLDTYVPTYDIAEMQKSTLSFIRLYGDDTHYTDYRRNPAGTAGIPSALGGVWEPIKTSELQIVGNSLYGAYAYDVDQVMCHAGTRYSWSGSLPKIIPAGSTPETSGGIGAGAWVDRTDVTLRSELASVNGVHLVGNSAFYVSDAMSANVTNIPDGASVICSSRNGKVEGGGIFNYSASSVLTVDNAIIFAPTIGSGRLIRQGYTAFGFNYPANLAWWGVVGDYNGTTGTDNTTAFNASQSSIHAKDFILPAGNYLMSIWKAGDGVTIKGVGKPTVSLKQISDSTTVKVQLGNNARHEDIKFVSVDADLEWQRATFENFTNSKAIRCGFFNFKNPTNMNAWGLYFSNSTNCEAIDCEFGGNSQSDIAVVDGNTNILIQNPYNSVDTNGVHLNIEPNGVLLNRHINVVGGVFREVDLLENNFTVYASKYVKFTNSIVTLLKYDGSGASFDASCDIQNIVNDGSLVTYSGALDCNLNLSGNLFTDPYFVDLANANGTAQWTNDYVSGGWLVSRIRDAQGSYVKLNAAAINQAFSIKSQKLTAVGGVSYVLVLNLGLIAPAGAGFIGNRAKLKWYNAGGTLIQTDQIVTARCSAGNSVDITPHIAVVDAPSNAATVYLQIGRDDVFSTCSDLVMSAGLFQVYSFSGGSTNTLATAQAMKAWRITTAATQPPTTSSHAGGFVGDRVVNSAPASGQPKAWVCTASPITWISEGNL